MTLDVREVRPGSWRLRLQLRIRGRAAVVRERVVEVLDPGASRDGGAARR